jgi:hypothetical protein
MSNSQQNKGMAEGVKFVVRLVAFLFLSGVSISTAVNARHYQVLGQLMPNGKGGLMTFRDGYFISSVTFLMALIIFASLVVSMRRSR